MKGVVRFSAFCGLAVAVAIGRSATAQYYDEAPYYSYPADYSYPSNHDYGYSSNLFDAPPLATDDSLPFDPPMPEAVPDAVAKPATKQRAAATKSNTLKATPVADTIAPAKAQPAVLKTNKNTKAKPVNTQQSVLTTPQADHKAAAPTAAANQSAPTVACQPVTGGKDPACDGCKFVLCPPTQPLVLNCDCCKDAASDECPLYRFLDYNKAVAFIGSNGLNPNCLVCVKEPFVCAHQVTEEVEIVLNRCKKTCNDKCEAGKCISESVSELEPCTAKYTLCHTKQYIKYCEVWIYIDCHHKVPAGTPPVID